MRTTVGLEGEVKNTCSFVSSDCLGVDRFTSFVGDFHIITLLVICAGALGQGNIHGVCVAIRYGTGSTIQALDDLVDGAVCGFGVGLETNAGDAKSVLDILRIHSSLISRENCTQIRGVVDGGLCCAVSLLRHHVDGFTDLIAFALIVNSLQLIQIVVLHCFQEVGFQGVQSFRLGNGRIVTQSPQVRVALGHRCINRRNPTVLQIRTGNCDVAQNGNVFPPSVYGILSGVQRRAIGKEISYVCRESACLDSNDTVTIYFATVLLADANVTSISAAIDRQGCRSTCHRLGAVVALKNTERIVLRVDGAIGHSDIGLVMAVVTGDTDTAL